MKIVIDAATGAGPQTIKLEHNGESMLWDTSPYSKASDPKTPMDCDRIFRELNAWWATLPTSAQTQFWDLYKEAHEVFETIFDVSALKGALQQIAKKMYDIESFGTLRHWLVYKSVVRIPNGLKERFEDIDKETVNFPHRKETTYLRNEYIDLAEMTIAFRAMVPIWSEFIRATRRETGANSKELEAYRLLYYTKLQQYPAMYRLLNYVQQTVRTLINRELAKTATLGGMSENEYEDYMLALTIVRRLAMCPISAEDDTSNIVTNIHQYVRMNVNTGARKVGKKFARVTFRQSDEIAEDGTKKSIAEAYNVKQEIPDGIKVLLAVYADQPMNVLLRVLKLTAAGDFLIRTNHSVEQTSEMVDTLRQRLAASLTMLQKIQPEVLRPHLTLIQWTLARVLPAPGIPLLTYEGIIKMMAVTQVVLWEWGFYDLAALSSASQYVMEDDAMIGAMEVRGRIPKELMDELNRRWPYSQPPRGKQSFRQSNTAAKAVDLMCEMLVESDWVLNCPRELVEQVSRTGSSRRYVVPADIRTSLAHLLIKIDNLSREDT